MSVPRNKPQCTNRRLTAILLSTATPCTLSPAALPCPPPEPSPRQPRYPPQSISISTTSTMLYQVREWFTQRCLLHVFHISLTILVVVFLAMSAVSGPSIKYWWIEVEYQNGEIWNLGGLGACQVGQKCVRPRSGCI